MGLFGGSTTTTTNEKFDTGPSGFQKPFLNDAFSGAQQAFNSQSGTPFYQGSLYAGMSPEAKAALDAMRGYASGQGVNGATQISQLGQSLAQNANRAPGMIDQFVSGMDPARLQATASNFAASPHVNAQIDAASTDIRRNLTENMLPGIDRAASAGGNINSSRAGIASGIAQRGAAEAIGNIGANIRGNAYNQGLGIAQNAATANLTGANAFSTVGQQGIDAFNSGTNAGYGAFDRVNQSFGIEQQDRQGATDADFRSWLGNDSRNWDILNNYMGIVGSNQWGQSGTSSGTSKSKEQGSIFGQLVGGAATAASLFSDRRLKKAIEKIGEFADGLGVYLWTYIWEPEDRRHMGVMADEVEELRPYALGPKIGDYRTVNYGNL